MKIKLTPNRISSLGEVHARTVENAELKYKSSVTKGSCRLEVRGSERETFTEFHLTATVVHGGVVETGGCAADDLIGQVVAELAKRRIQPIRCSPRQDQSFNYGSAFSRGMTFNIEGKKTVHISGTASINTAGASTHIGNAECQSFETLMSIGAILEAQGGSLRNITSATLFCKDQAAYEAWNRVTRLLQIPDFPKICVRADVCRDDLLVEMETVAVI